MFLNPAPGGCFGKGPGHKAMLMSTWFCTTQPSPGQATCRRHVLGPAPDYMATPPAPPQCCYLPIQDPVQKVQDFPECSEGPVLGQGLMWPVVDKPVGHEDTE